MSTKSPSGLYDGMGTSNVKLLYMLYRHPHCPRQPHYTTRLSHRYVCEFFYNLVCDPKLYPFPIFPEIRPITDSASIPLKKAQYYKHRTCNPKNIKEDTPLIKFSRSQIRVPPRARTREDTSFAMILNIIKKPQPNNWPGYDKSNIAILENTHVISYPPRIHR